MQYIRCFPDHKFRQIQQVITFDTSYKYHDLSFMIYDFHGNESKRKVGQQLKLH